MKKSKKTKNILIGCLLIIILVMSVGYASLATTFNITGTAEIIGEWDVRITNIETISVSEGSSAGTPSFTNTTATFDVKLNKPGDEVVYQITIENRGTIDAKLGNIIFTEDVITGTSAINYTTSSLKNELNAKETTTFTVTITYLKEIEEVPEIKTKSYTGVIEYVQK